MRKMTGLRIPPCGTQETTVNGIYKLRAHAHRHGGSMGAYGSGGAWGGFGGVPPSR